MMFMDTADQIAQDIADVRAMYAMEQYAAPEPEDTADDYADMHAWAAHVENAEQFDRLMRRAGSLLDRAYSTRIVGYARSAIRTAEQAQAYAMDAYGTGEVAFTVTEAQRLIDRLTRSVSYAGLKG